MSYYKKVPIILFSGYANSGKTTIIGKIVKEMSKNDYKLAVIKHHEGMFDLDKEGTDSYKVLEAGASRVILSSDRQYVDIQKIEEEKKLAEIVKGITDVDLIIVEGYKNSSYPKIEVYREELYSKRIENNVVAIITNLLYINDKKIPQFAFDEIERLIMFLESEIMKV